MTLLIKNGTIVNADGSRIADILVEGNKITQIGSTLAPALKPNRTIDASGCYVIPGGIDPHVHMHLPTPTGYSADDFESGSKSALHGGTTTFIDFVTPHKGEALAGAIDQRKKEASKCFTDYSFHVSPVEWHDGLQDEISACINKEGFRSFKVYMAYKDTIGLSDPDLLKVMKTVGKAGGMITIHCELGDEIETLRNQLVADHKHACRYHALSRPPETEALAVKKAIQMAEKARCPLYVVHVSAKESVKYIADARKKGQEVYAETCPQYLLFDDALLEGPFEEAAKFVFSPPLRKQADNEALWKALQNGIIDTIGTDHCPFTQSLKNFGRDDFRKIPNGAGGVEHRLSLLYTYGVLKGRISMEQFVALTSAQQAKIFGLFPRKGKIASGSDADLVIWNPEKENHITASSSYSKSDLNIYEGIRIKGQPDFVIKGGVVVQEENKLLNHLYPGKLLKTNPF